MTFHLLKEIISFVIIFAIDYNDGMKKLTKMFGYTVLVLGSLSMLVPFLWMFFMSFADNSVVFSPNFSALIKSFGLQNYKSVFLSIPVGRYFLNSLFVALLTTFFQVLISALAGYAFARFDFKHKEIIFLVILVTMMIPPQVNIIPLFFLMRELHWVDTYQALIVPGIFGGFGVFMMRQWFKTLPKNLEDAALVDGSNIYKTFFYIALPLALPALVTLAIFTFITTWNSFMWPLIITSSDSMKTLTVGLAAFKGSFREITEWADIFACAVICVLPVIFVFLLGKKYFINDLLAGSMKE